MNDAPITQQEMTAILDFFKKHNIAWLGAEGDRNGATFGEYFDQWMTSAKQNIAFTPQSLEVAFKKLKEAESLIFYTPDESQYHLYEETYPAQLETIRKFLPTYGLSASKEDDSLYVNTNIIMEYCVSTSRAHQITKESLQTLIMGNLLNRPGTRQFRWAPTPRQDWEKERDRKRAAEQEAIEHYRQYHKENDPNYQEEQRQKKLAEQQAQIGQDNDSYWRQRVESYLASIQSHVLREEARQLYGTKQMNGNWQVNFVSLDNFIQRKKNQSSATLWAR